jgi:hydroxymethylpyrimidine pyrophosphatase-like HAD family hydrolase
MNKETVKVPELKLPESKLLLVDLDKTLIDAANYEITDKTIVDEIKRVQQIGWKIGLSSDSPLESLLDWRNQLAMNGPVIAEKGAVVWIDSKHEVIEKESQKFFSDLNLKFTNYLTDQRKSFLFGDVTKFIWNKPKLVEMLDDEIVLVQSHRKCSFNLYGRSINQNGELIINNQLTKEMIIIVHSLTFNNLPFEVDEDFNQDYGIYILAPKNTTKRLGTQKLINILNINKIGMIGDSGTDILGKDIAYQYAVGNAKPELKNVSEYVATGTFTKGVIEILRLIK